MIIYLILRYLYLIYFSPTIPAHMDWASHYPTFVAKDEKSEDATGLLQEDTPAVQKLLKAVEIADIGCGFGGLLFALAPRFPKTLLVGR